MKACFLNKFLLLTTAILNIVISSSKADEIIFSRLSINDGLLTNFVNCVWQDQKGFIWVGTQSGLQRYDSNRFVQVYNETNRTLPVLPVKQIIGDRQHQMWLNFGRVIGRFDLKTNRFIKADISALPDAGQTLYVDSRGNILSIAFGLSIYKYNTQNNRFESWGALKVPNNWGVLNIFEDVKNGYYIVCGKAGMGVCDLKHQAFYHEGYNPLNLPVLNLHLGTSIVRVLIDSHRRYWILKWPLANPSQFYCYNERTGKLKSHEEDLQPDFFGYREILNINEVNGQVWVSGENILNIFNEETGKFYKFYDRTNTSYGIKFSLIQQIYGDADQNIWVAGDNGLYMATNTRSRIRHGQLPTTNTDVNDIAQLSTGAMVIATWGSGIFPFDINNTDLTLSADSAFRKHFHNGSSVFAGSYMSNWCIAEHSVTRHVYVGCQAGILIDYDPVTKKSVFVDNQAVFKNSTIRCIAEDGQHNLWFGSQSGKLIEKTVNGNFEFVTDFGRRIVKIILSIDNNLWLATAGKGIIVFDPVKRKVIHNYMATADDTHSLSTNFLNDVVYVNDSLYAVACSENLDLLNVKTGIIKKLSVYNGLPMPAVNCLVMDKLGQLWMANSGGIVRYNFKKQYFQDL